MEGRDDELSRYPHPAGMFVVNTKNYRPPTPSHPAFSFYHMVKFEQVEDLNLSCSHSFTSKSVSQRVVELGTVSVVLLGCDIQAQMGDETETERTGLLDRPKTYQRTLSASVDRAEHTTYDYQM